MIELKEHNRKPYEALREKLKRTDRCAYISATGTGKSYVGGKLIEDEGYKALILVPSLEIARGWQELLPAVPVETYQGLHKADLTGVDLLICDEMHHLGADIWGENFHSLIDGFEGRILGMTATPVRFLDKGRNMVEELFDNNQVIGVELPEAIEKGILPSFDYITALYNLPSYLPGAEYRNATTEKLYAKLDAMGNSYSLQNIMRKHMKPGPHRVVVFVGKIAEVPDIMRIVRDAYPDAGHFAAHSDMTDGERRLAIESFKNAEDTVFLYTVDLLNEGVHIPQVDTVVMFRKTISPTIYLQQLGRALSTEMKEQRIQIFDFVANHDNIKTCLGAGDSVMGWIREGIGNEERQIVVKDYAMQEWELVTKLRQRVFSLWANPEERATFYTVMRQLYPTKDGLAKVQEMYPDLDRHYIAAIANMLGLRMEGQTKHLTQDVKAFILANPEMKSNDVLNEFPDCTLSQIRSFRNKNGLYDNRVVWKSEWDKLILAHPEMSCKQMQRELFPEIGESVIRKRRKELGWTAPSREEWPKDKAERFCSLFMEGGTRWVQQDAVFAGMSSYEVERHAAKYKLRRGGRQVNFNWTKEESDILAEELKKPRTDRTPYEEIAKKMPRHTPLAIKRRMKRMSDKMSNFVDDNS